MGKTHHEFSSYVNQKVKYGSTEGTEKLAFCTFCGMFPLLIGTDIGKLGILYIYLSHIRPPISVSHLDFITSKTTIPIGLAPQGPKRLTTAYQSHEAGF